MLMIQLLSIIIFIYSSLHSEEYKPNNDPPDSIHFANGESLRPEEWQILEKLKTKPYSFNNEASKFPVQQAFFRGTVYTK